jgi:hypothetical protein
MGAQLLRLLLGGEQYLRGRLADQLELPLDRCVSELSRRVGLDPFHQVREEPVDLVLVVAAAPRGEALDPKALDVLDVHRDGA